MTNKEKKYERMYLQLKELLAKDTSLIAQLATINAILYHKFPSFFWVGFYFNSNNRLLVGPYQGPVACQELEYPKGVCWACIIKKESLVVKNVEDFPDHIACDSRSKSEIVIPVFDTKNEVLAVLDIDSDKQANFDNEDVAGLSKIVGLIRKDLILKFKPDM